MEVLVAFYFISVGVVVCKVAEGFWSLIMKDVVYQICLSKFESKTTVPPIKLGYRDLYPSTCYKPQPKKRVTKEQLAIQQAEQLFYSILASISHQYNKLSTKERLVVKELIKIQCAMCRDPQMDSHVPRDNFYNYYEARGVAGHHLKKMWDVAYVQQYYYRPLFWSNMSAIDDCIDHLINLKSDKLDSLVRMLGKVVRSKFSHKFVGTEWLLWDLFILPEVNKKITSSVK